MVDQLRINSSSGGAGVFRGWLYAVDLILQLSCSDANAGSELEKGQEREKARWEGRGMMRAL